MSSTGVKVHDDGHAHCHAHCSSCFQRKCHYDGPDTFCNVTPCDAQCGAIFHSCKRSEHRAFCSLEIVACPNIKYGCSATLRRRDTARHLVVCPASVVYCRLEWFRRSELGDQKSTVSVRERSQIKSLLAATGEPDVTTALDSLAKARSCQADSYLGSRTDTAPRDSEHAPVGGGRAVNHCGMETVPCYNVSEPLDMNREALKTQQSRSLQEQVVASVGARHDADMESNCKADSVGLDVGSENSSSAVLDRLTTDHVDESADVTEDRSNCVSGTYLNCIPLALNDVLYHELNHYITTDTAACFSPQSTTNVFICGKIVRRDQYGRHIQTVHKDIHGGYPEWLEHRCPLAEYGCKFSIPRFQPENNSLVFSELLDNFGLQSHQSRQETESTLSALIHNRNPSAENSLVRTNSDWDASKTSGLHSCLESPGGKSKEIELDGEELESRDSSNESPFASLPTELLEFIARYLDSFSLCNLSLTCWSLRNICQSLVRQRGIVVQKWKKTTGEDGRTTWIPSKQCRMFSTVCDPIEKWKIVDQSPMLRHVKHCPYNEKCELPDSPIELPILGLNLEHVLMKLKDR